MTLSPTPRSLSGRESHLLGRLVSRDKQLFTIADARAALGEDAPYAALILHRLAAKRWLKRIARGRYRLIPLEAGPEAAWAEHAFRIAATFVSPYYLAYATALAYYGYTERALDPIWIATTRARKPVVLDGVTYRFVALKPARFFGYTQIEVLGSPVAIAQRERAVADGLDRPAYCGGVIEAAKGLWFGRDELDLERLIGILERLGNRAAIKRLGFWLERMGLADEGLLRTLEPRDRNYALLEPGGAGGGPKAARWRLVVNIPERQLLEWRES
jgi:predicted transcriptional regulator of viral defense system